MGISAVFAGLAAELGISVAKELVRNLSSKKKSSDRFDKVERLIASGRTAVEACKEVFGDDFLTALNQKRVKRTSLTFESGQRDYVPVIVRSNSRVKRLHALRDEISLNLQRVSEMSFKDDAEMQSYFLGVMRAWMRRYEALVRMDDEAKKAFATMESLLDGGKRTFADALKILQQGGLPTLGALMIIYAVMVATGTGVGVAASIGLFLFGIPVAHVATLVVGGALIAALSRVKFTATNAMSTCIAVAYRLLEEREKSMSNNEETVLQVG